MAQERLATTTACGHEVQGRELAGDRHVGFSVHHCGVARSRCGQDVAGGGVGAPVESLGILLNLLEHFAVGGQAGMGLVEQEKVIVPFTEGFLGGLVAGG